MAEKLCLFAGTTEGRRLAQILGAADGVELTVCVATEYGEVLLDGIAGIEVHAGRMDEEDMARFFEANGFSRILDATHPYAEAVTANIREAAAGLGVPVTRVLRDTEADCADAVWVSSVEEARDWLVGREGNIFLTTGAKELSGYVGLDMNRVWARVLPTPSSLASCAEAGIPTSHIIAAQGPFPEDVNLAEMKRIGADYLVTKASGKTGGFDEKIRAARTLGAIPVIIGHRPETAGVSMDEALRELGLPLPRRSVVIIGIGPGGAEEMTARARTALRDADAVLGAKSVAEPLEGTQPAFYEYLPDKVRAVLDEHPSIRRAAVLMRGDVGFYSGAKKLTAALTDYDVTLIPGVSSVSAFAAALGVSWDDAALVSLHGRDGAFIRTIDSHKKTFALTGGENSAAALLERMCEFGFGDLPTAVGELLGCPGERISRGTAQELKNGRFDALAVLYVENENAVSGVRSGIPDDAFIRGEVPMTKSEVRAVSLSKLCLPEDAVVYDVGAGTGSVSVECALAASRGTVYAVERDEDAAELIRKNRIRFKTDNLNVIVGTAPDALADLPAPTHAFIGGSGGGLKAIVETLVKKNPDVRIVVNAVTLETQAEAAECASAFGFRETETLTLNVARARRVGRYRMMTAQNPVTVTVMQGGGLHE